MTATIQHCEKLYDWLRCNFCIASIGHKYEFNSSHYVVSCWCLHLWLLDWGFGLATWCSVRFYWLKCWSASVCLDSVFMQVASNEPLGCPHCCWWIAGVIVWKKKRSKQYQNRSSHCLMPLIHCWLWFGLMECTIFIGGLSLINCVFIMPANIVEEFDEKNSLLTSFKELRQNENWLDSCWFFQLLFGSYRHKEGIKQFVAKSSPITVINRLQVITMNWSWSDFRRRIRNTPPKQASTVAQSVQLKVNQVHNWN